ncbi:Spermidine Putrescine ABC transporter permease component PotB (TC 3.A.1.11.1) [hydrothermal vent metagenome]|uniref:Spermidine Putrescine ABC transporter permease component PotB (TC 3.A.1.11.1) n=1 Tax=hydrothermal vent metagenome TaxID=652676 RepID=A0A3B0U300_9ZZZZ
MVATDISTADPQQGGNGNGVITAADGTPLKTALARANVRARRRAFFLVLPLLAFVVLTFAIPIGQLLYRSIYNAAFSDNMPQLTAWFAANPQATGVPGESGFEALALDLIEARKDRTIGRVGVRVNYELPGSTSLFKSTARKAKRFEAPPYREKLLEINGKWDNPVLWDVMRRASNPYTITFYLAALDLAFSPDGEVAQVDEKRRIYVPLFMRTLILSAVIGLLCLLLGFPIAHLLATLPLRYSNLLMIFVLLPFWTSLLVRTTSWIVLLQSQGVVNDVLVALGIIGDDGRIQMMYNQIGTIVAMTHILLPFMVLPLYSVMKTIPPSYVRAARSLGANPFTAFWRVYFPLTVPGIGAGSLLVFILAIGYYITPALVGGATGQLISNLIAFHMLSSLNWSLAAALAALLLAGVILLYWLYDRIVGVDKMKLG